jgi:hypothetical protein
MVEENELLATLKQFTGCDQLARLTRTVLLTEGSRYLAEAAECFWQQRLVHVPKTYKDKPISICIN